MAISYFRLLAKKGASRPFDGDRIQNAFVKPLHIQLPDALRRCGDVISVHSCSATVGLRPPKHTGALCDFDMTLGYPGEGPKWSVISANVDSFATNSNCLQGR